MKCFKNFQIYTDNSTIHGVKYLGESNRHWLEKIFWISSITICFVLLSFTIREIYDNWDENPVLLTFAEKTHSISDIPFPAVTICPVTQIDRNKLNFTEFVQYFKNTQSGEIFFEKAKSFEAALHLCTLNYSQLFQILFNQSFLESDNFVNEILKISLEPVMTNCNWRRRNISCHAIFTPILTSQGICYSYNILHSSDIIKQEK